MMTKLKLHSKLFKMHVTYKSHAAVKIYNNGVRMATTEAALLENNEASAKLTTANGGTFT